MNPSFLSNFEFFFSCFFFQERLESIIDQLKSLGSQQDELKVQLQQAHELQNFPAATQLQSELDHISTQQMQLINEQSEVSRQLRRFERCVSEKKKKRIICCTILPWMVIMF